MQIGSVSTRKCLLKSKGFLFLVPDFVVRLSTILRKNPLNLLLRRTLIKIDTVKFHYVKQFGKLQFGKLDNKKSAAVARIGS